MLTLWIGYHSPGPALGVDWGGLGRVRGRTGTRPGLGWLLVADEEGRSWGGSAVQQRGRLGGHRQHLQHAVRGAFAAPGPAGVRGLHSRGCDWAAADAGRGRAWAGTALAGLWSVGMQASPLELALRAYLAFNACAGS